MPKAIDLPLRIPITEVLKVNGLGTVVVGRVETGKLRTGMPIRFTPGGLTATCDNLEVNNVSVDEAVPGDNIGFRVKGINKADLE